MYSGVELRHLRSLAALRDSDTMLAAAERIYLTQSALSHQLKDLEDRLGCRLFIRKTRPVRFTAAGRRVLQLADEVLPLMRRATWDLDRLAGGESGRLFVAIECHSCLAWLLPAIDAYRKEWPEIDLDISSGFNFEPLPALRRGDLDLVVTSNKDEKGGLAYLPMFGYEMQAVMAVDHPLASKKWLAPEDFSEETLISYPVDRSRMDLLTHFLDPAGVEARTGADVPTHRHDDAAGGERAGHQLAAELGAARVHRARVRGGAVAGGGRRLAGPVCGGAPRTAIRAVRQGLRGGHQEDLP